MDDFKLGLLVLFLLALAAGGTYIRKLLRELDTKERAIIGLKEIIRLLEERIK